jgi:nascent polypeptide-associated complex subunit beta
MRRNKVAKKQRSNADASDAKKIEATLKKFSCSNLPGIEEVNMFKEDGNVIHFKNPKVTASPTSNTFTVSGHNDVKKITEIPGVLNQLGLEGLQGLQQWAKSQGLGSEPVAKKQDLNDTPVLTTNFKHARVYLYPRRTSRSPNR